MNSKERVLATMRHEPTDRTPIDCWLYQKQFVEKLEADFGPRDRFWDEFNIDINIGFVPWPINVRTPKTKILTGNADSTPVIRATGLKQ